MKTIYANPQQVERKWYVIDADGVRLGRLATKVATLLRGKHKPEFAPHQEIGDYVIVVNADKIEVTGRKPERKIYWRHSGFTGSLRGESFQTMMSYKPTYPVEKAVRGMLPKNRLGRKLFKNLRVYAGPEHPHAAQKPEQLEL
jgi:large subunit ribosomal protein L13